MMPSQARNTPERDTPSSSTMATVGIVLAAGRGTRMYSTTPKVLHPLGGVPMVGEEGVSRSESCSSTVRSNDEPRSIDPPEHRRIESGPYRYPVV